MDYHGFLEGKLSFETGSHSIDAADINPMLFPFQQDITRWSLKKGRAAIFAGTGLGKTPMQLEWANQVNKSTGGDVLILAPLAVSKQTVREGAKFDIDVNLCRHQADVKPGINITNYEMLDHFTPESFSGVVLDESSILKAHDGKTRTHIIESFQTVPYRLACTATPAPNDHMELGNHAEFLGVMTRAEMLSMFFIHDGGDTAKWRLKGHGVKRFWEWVASWAVMLTKPSDLGYDDEGFDLPPLNIHQITIDAENVEGLSTLFPTEAQTLLERRQARRDSTADRVAKCAEIVNSTDDTWLIWCGLNNESQALTAAIEDAVEVKGADTSEHKENSMMGFSGGEVKRLVSKASICGFGMNWQHCNKMAFVGLSDSFEQMYQAIRRCWRFGQTNPVDVYVITVSTEGAVVRNIKRKERDFEKMLSGMIAATQEITKENIVGTKKETAVYATDKSEGDGWKMMLGDSVELIKSIDTDSIHYSIFSPPFASLYTYSNSERDMGNCRDYDDFGVHFRFLVDELFRVMMPGRLLSFHCMNLPTSKQHHGFIGIQDFRGDLIRQFVDAGFIFHSEVCIWKDPVTAMQRTKALGLLHKQIKKDSCMSRQGVPDYLVTMRKPGDNPERVTHTNESFPVKVWQNYASPVWMDINPSKTLQRASARENDDERHICPLQLEVIERAVRLWTNPGDVILSPFAGIGSEGYVAIQEGRQYVGMELKKSYYDCAVNNLAEAVMKSQEETLFSGVK